MVAGLIAFIIGFFIAQCLIIGGMAYNIGRLKHKVAYLEELTTKHTGAIATLYFMIRGNVEQHSNPNEPPTTSYYL